MKKKHGIFQKRDYINAIYQVDFYLGENDACEIYRVFDAKNELKLLKLIKPDLVSNVDLKKIAIELKRFSALCHQNIISNSELSSFQIKENTYYYYVLDFISGESLEYLLNRCLTVDIKKSCDIVLNIIKAVLFLHDLDEPYIFGNITPNSVFINYEDREIGRAHV